MNPGLHENAKSGIAIKLEMGATVIASSARAARALRRVYAEAQREHGISGWRAPEILDWEGWLELLWQQRLRTGGEARLLLSRVQEHEVWVRLIRPSLERRYLISTDGVADLAQEAYDLLCAYDALNFLQTKGSGADVDSFCEWGRAFEQECHEQQWLSRSRLPLALRQAVLGGEISLPTELVLTGFDRTTPAQKNLIEACLGHGCSVEWVEADTQAAAEILVVEAMDTREEVITCAWWARRLLERAEAANERVRIGIMVQNVSSVRGEMERIFRHVLAPQSTPIGLREAPLPFEFTLGTPLAEVPMARSALLLLRWMEEPLRQEELTWLILSGFLWKSEADFLPLARFDATTRKVDVLPPEQELNAYLRQPGWRQEEALTGLRNRLYDAQRAWTGRSARNGSPPRHEERAAELSFADWVERVEHILAAAGWPGAHRMESEEFQAWRRWAQLLDGLATLGFDGRRVRYAEFLRVLKRQAEKLIFAPESRGAAVQIMGPFEAAGVEFDAVWFIGADDDSWPAPARPHPFLTQTLQKLKGMPHADNNADWELARRVTERIRRSAARCVFSYSVQDKNGQRRPSTVLDRAGGTSTATQIREHLRVQEPPEQPALAVEEEEATGIAWPKERHAGGYSVLKSQAACPFQAFATYRLAVKEIDRNDWGLDPRDRGNLLHKILQELWGELKDHGSLVKARSTGELPEIIARHVDQAINRYRGPKTELGREEQPWSSAYLDAERERVIRLVEEWLSYEEERTPFRVVQQEQGLEANVGGLTLKLRADRIDSVAGGHLLIDYKTGPVNVNAWDGERPDEPQLPLYAAYGNVESLRGVVLAQIRTDSYKFVGRLEEPELTFSAKKAKLERWPFSEEIKQQWQSVLLKLGEQFLKGDARVDPKQYPKTCEFCALPGLCRVAETRRDVPLDTDQTSVNRESRSNGEEPSDE